MIMSIATRILRRHVGRGALTRVTVNVVLRSCEKGYAAVASREESLKEGLLPLRNDAFGFYR